MPQPTMQVTGSNAMSNDKVVSTRLVLSGHNFSAEQLPPSGGAVQVFLDTAETLLVPVQMYEEGMQTGYMQRSGMFPTAGESIVVSAPMNDTVALMLFPTDAVKMIADRFEYCSFLSPLQVIAGERNVVRLHMTERSTYVALSDSALRFADVFEERNTDSVLYILQTLKKDFTFPGFRIKVSGEGAQQAAHELSVYYKTEVCEL